MNEEHECLIGHLYSYDSTELITFKELKKEADINKYLDRRRAYMCHFNYCPVCSKEIDWKAFKKEVREEI